jgi:hypothetical protein
MGGRNPVDAPTRRDLGNVKRCDRAGLQKFIHWKKDEGVVYKSNPGGFRVIASKHIRSEIFSRFQVGDSVAPSWSLIQQITNEKLAEHRVHARLLWDSRYTALALHIVPESLVGCLWLQFCQAIEGDKKYRQCENCRTWFEIGGGRAARGPISGFAHQAARQVPTELSTRKPYAYSQNECQ